MTLKDAALAIVFNHNKTEVLLVKRRDIPIWVLPGGGIDEGETSEETALREVYEETGLKVALKRKAAEYTPINSLASLTHVFECEKKEGALSLSDETAALGFFPISQLPNELFFLHRKWLEEALVNESRIVKRKITEITFFQLGKYFLRHPLIVLRSLLSRFGFAINS